MKLSEAQTEAVARLQTNKDFMLMLEAITAHRDDALELAMFTQDNGKALVMRGVARGITEVMRGLGVSQNKAKIIRNHTR